MLERMVCAGLLSTNEQGNYRIQDRMFPGFWVGPRIERKTSDKNKTEVSKLYFTVREHCEKFKAYAGYPKRFFQSHFSELGVFGDSNLFPYPNANNISAQEWMVLVCKFAYGERQAKHLDYLFSLGILSEHEAGSFSIATYCPGGQRNSIGFYLPSREDSQKPLYFPSREIAESFLNALKKAPLPASLKANLEIKASYLL